MRKANMYVISLLSVLLFCSTYQIIIYKSWTNRLEWSTGTLAINYLKVRNNWLECEFMGKIRSE